MKVGRSERLHKKLALEAYTRKGRGSVLEDVGKSVYYRAVKGKDLESGQGFF